MKKIYKRLFVVLTFILVALFSFIIYNQWPLMTGTEVILKTQPVDPFDLFKGQYMIVNYDISRLNNNLNFSEKDTVYVSLKKSEDEIWIYDNALKLKPTNGIFIKGKIKSIRLNEMRIEYGIEQYFFERHAILPTENITVKVKIANSGRAKISQMLHNSKLVIIEYEEFDIKS